MDSHVGSIMIMIQLGGYTKEDLKKLIKALHATSDLKWCLGEQGDYEKCRTDSRNCEYYRVCKDITSALNFLYSRSK